MTDQHETDAVHGMPCTLEACTMGLFLYRSRLGFKSEYRTQSAGAWMPDAYCGDSGEYFWGGAASPKQRSELVVTPVNAEVLLRRAAQSAPADDVERVAHAWYAERELWHFDNRQISFHCRRSEKGPHGKTEWFSLGVNFRAACKEFTEKTDRACARAALAAMPSARSDAGRLRGLREAAEECAKKRAGTHGTGAWAEGARNMANRLEQHFRAAILDRAAASQPPATGQEAEDNQAARDVLAERRRQVEVEGWTPEHDDAYARGEMARAGAGYAYHAGLTDEQRAKSLPQGWPAGWSFIWWKPTTRRRDLVKAGALILAEIERLDRLPPAPEARR